MGSAVYGQLFLGPSWTRCLRCFSWPGTHFWVLVGAENGVQQARKACVEIAGTQRRPAPCAVLALSDHPGLAEHPEVMRESRGRDVDREGAAGPLGLDPQCADDPHTGGVGQCVQYVEQVNLAHRGMCEISMSL